LQTREEKLTKPFSVCGSGARRFRRDQIRAWGHWEAAFATADAPGASGERALGIIFATMMLTTLRLLFSAVVDKIW